MPDGKNSANAQHDEKPCHIYGYLSYDLSRERLLISPIVNIGSYRSIRVVSRLVEMNRPGVRNAPLDILA